MFVDARYGITRINTRNEADTFDDFDYSQFGIPAAMQALIIVLAARFNSVQRTVMPAQPLQLARPHRLCWHRPLWKESLT